MGTRLEEALVSLTRKYHWPYCDQFTLSSFYEESGHYHLKVQV